jgi:hypothetical protein
MALQPYEKFKGVTDWRKDGFNDNLQYGITEWVRWAMLQVGGFENVERSQASGLYGGHPAILHVVDDPNYQAGQVWEALRSDWVWETGISYGVQPRACSGVAVNNTFYDTETTIGDYAHYVDFPRGRVVFDAPISSASDVRCDYAFRAPTIGPAKEPWLQELMYGSLDVHQAEYLNTNRLSEARRRMPTVAVELSQRSGYRPYQLGGGQFVFQDIIFYILSETKDERDKLVNILGNQSDKVIVLPNRGAMKSSGAFPVDIDVMGRPVTNPMQYPQIVADTNDGGFAWTRVMLKHAHTQNMQTTNNWLYRGTLRLTCEAIFENI